MPTMSDESKVSELDVALINSLVQKGAELDVIVKAMRPAQAPALASKPPSNVAPAVITTEQRAALKSLNKVYGKVVPTTVRALTEPEIRSLIEEWKVIGELIELTAQRKAAIRTTVLNHHDVLFEVEHELVLSKGERDKEGHYLYARKVGVDDKDDEFSWEIGSKGGGLVNEVLQEILDHKDWLFVSVPTREVDGDRFMELLKKKPELAEKLAEAVVPGTKYGSLNYRTKKDA